MSDEILDRIDAVLGHEDTVIEDDWAVSGDAMRSRPPADGDTPYEPELNPPARATLVQGVGDLRAPTTAEVNAGIDLSEFIIRRTWGYAYLPSPRSFAPPRGRVLELFDTLGLTPHLERVCVGITRLVGSIRQRHEPRRAGARSVTVTLTADTRAFTEAMGRFGAALNQVGRASSISAAQFAAIQAELADQIDRCLELELDKASMRRLARRETVLARVWLDQHVDNIYADLGLARPQEDTTP